MSDLVYVDPYGAAYELEKIKNPSFQVQMRAYPKWVVESVNNLTQKSRGRSTVSSQSDWDLVDDIIKFFIRLYPEEWKTFASTIPDIRGTRNKGGYSPTKEIKYIAALPVRLERLIKRCFPQQQYDKKFVNLFAKRYKVFKVG